MITHELLIAAIQKKYPNLVHGEDFTVAHPVKGNKQTGPAWIMQWRADGIPEPDETELAQLRLDAAKLQTEVQSKNARTYRDTLILASDFSQLPDVQASFSDEQKAAWAAYRKALREVPTQPGFPAEINWPKKPV